MKLSVIIPCYNAEDTLADQLDALAAQESSFPWEVIISDNGSTDRTLSVARSFHERLPRLKIIRAGDRRGASHARNRGVEVASSECLAFCDADDVVGPGYVQAITSALENHEFVACRYEFKKLNRRWISRLPGMQLTAVDRGWFGPFAYAGGGSIAIRRRVHELVGGFDEENFPVLQDTDYCIRIQRAGILLHFVADGVIHYRWRTTAWRAFIQARGWGRDLIALRARHWPTDEPPESARSLIRYFFSIRTIRNLDQLAVWVWSLGWRVGSIQGWRQHLRSSENRTSYPGGSGGDGMRNRQRVRLFLMPALARRIKALILAGAGSLVMGAMPIGIWARNKALRGEFGSIESTSQLAYPLKIDGAQHICIGARAHIGSGSWLYAVTSFQKQVFNPQIRIGEKSHIGRHCHIVATNKISIGNEVILGEKVYLSDNLHDYRRIDRSIAANELISCGEIHIGKGSVIEENVCIVGNVQIGESCVVSANSVVNRNVPSFSVAAGIPARIVRRFNPVSERWEPTNADGSFTGSGDLSAGSLFARLIVPESPSPS